uniref:helix-turn-helix transcriptional regulator n=1 Tax=Streptomyces anthocyanicus TaxID=68174 RepID=UPI002F91691F|nr:LuxR C-terminal-related transcriptional regulator [Streptomyces anthocyanicus]
MLGLVHHREGGVLWVEGPADAGKSRLLTEAAQEAAVAGALALTGSGTAGGALPPLTPLIDALGPVSTARGTGPGSPYESVRGVEDRLRTLARGRPLVVTLDDVQHCDDLTLRTVSTLTARLSALPLLWVLASRSHLDVPAVEALRCALPAGRTSRLELAPWEPDAVRLLIADLLGPRSGEAEPYLPLLGGMPGAVRQLCALLADEEPGPVRGRGHRAGSGTVARNLVAHRLDRLTRNARDLVLTASALDAALGVRHLCRLLDSRESTVLQPLREVLAAGLMRADEDQFVFAHPSVRDAVAATLPPPLSRSLRRRSIDLRLAEGTSPATLAAEIAEVAEPGDEPALRVLESAARELAPLSPSGAAAHLRRAVDLSRTDPPRRLRLAAKLVPLLWESGEPEEARALAREVLRAPPDAATHARVCLELIRTGGPFPVPHAEAHLRRALHHHDVPLAVKDQLLSTTLLHRLLTGEAEEAGGAVAGSMARARGTHPLNDLTQRTLRSMSACHRQRWTEALAHSEPVPAKAAELDPAHGPALPEVVLSTAWRAALLGLSGAGRAATDLVEEGLADARRRGRPAYLPLWRTARARLMLDGGRLVEAAQEVVAAGPGSRAPGTSAASDAALACVRARIAHHTGDNAELEECAALAEGLLAGDDPQSYRAGAWIALLTAGYRDRALTHQRLAAATDHLRRGFVHTTCVDAGDVVLLVAAALDSGRREVAAAAVDFAEERATLNPGIALFAAAASHARGLFARDAELLAGAAEAHGDTRPLLRARALEDAGACSPEPSGAALSRFEEALRRYEACGAEGDARRVRGRLRAFGVRTLPSAGTAAPAANVGWRGLSGSELSVARLIAHGATNREAAQRLFLSPHTVNTHLRHVFVKLGIRSRVQLARLYAREIDSRGASA